MLLRALESLGDDRQLGLLVHARQQLELGLRIRDRIAEVHDAVSNVRSLAEQIESARHRAARAGREEAFDSDVEALLDELDAIERLLIAKDAEEVLDLSRSDLDHSWSVLRDYGNMSSVTVLFILKRAMEAGASGRHLMAAFGPGFSAYFLVADL